MSAADAAAAQRGPGGGRRLTGVDVARGLALLAMMATHVLPTSGPTGATLTGALFSGRASALFAVLAGVGLALLTGGPRPHRGAELAASRRAVLGRAAVITAVGLVLGLWPSGIAVILVNYGVLFAVAAVFLGLRARALVPLALGWLVLAPVLSHAVRPLLPGRTGPSPSLLSLLHPLRLTGELLVTGYYPVLVWTGYLLVGLAVGRLPLRRAGVAPGVLVTGVVAAAGAEAASAALVRAAGGIAAITGQAQVGTLYGTTPTTTWWWLAVRAPHAGTPVDLVHTAGTALVVLGAALLLTRWRPAELLLTPLAAVGSLTLSLYTAHVLVRPLLGPLLPDALDYALQATAAVALASLWRAGAAQGVLPRRGPLEEVAAGAAAAARGVSAPRAG